MTRKLENNMRDLVALVRDLELGYESDELHEEPTEVLDRALRVLARRGQDPGELIHPEDQEKLGINVPPADEFEKAPIVAVETPNPAVATEVGIGMLVRAEQLNEAWEEYDNVYGDHRDVAQFLREEGQNIVNTHDHDGAADE